MSIIVYSNCSNTHFIFSVQFKSKHSQRRLRVDTCLVDWFRKLMRENNRRKHEKGPSFDNFKIYRSCAISDCIWCDEFHGAHVICVVATVPNRRKKIECNIVSMHIMNSPFNLLSM